MKRLRPIARFLALLLLTNATACSTPDAQAETPPAPGNVEVIGAVFANLDVRFPAQQSCGGNAAMTVGEYLQHALGYLAEEQKDNGGVAVNCSPSKLNEKVIDFYSMRTIYPERAVEALRAMNKGEPVFQCTLTINYNAGELAWSRGVQFLMRGKDHSLVDSTVRCMSMP